ncbi:MAG: efflux RND transporter periplasmic adaptor subunit [Abditibacteriales bacterium]|nr:efflux RND transporter periplasmic adaptor subunit [Abditibacteriales bacterium]MDW8364698.1 efflux RND transporter periplasmic adaptor subunit [Abditibacteriales bacterium]
MARARLFVFLIVLATGVGALGMWKARQRHAVEVVTVRRAALTATLSATGFVEATEVTITAKVTGRIAAILVDEGSTVRRGQPLIRLDTPDLAAHLQVARGGQAAAQAQERVAADIVNLTAAQVPTQVTQAHAALAAAQAQLEKLQRGARPEEIQEARAAAQQASAGLAAAQVQLARAQVALEQQKALSEAQLQQALAALAAARAREEMVLQGARPQEIAQAQARLRDAQARCDGAAREWERMKQLFAEGAIPKQQLDQAETALETAKAAEAAAREDLDLIRAGAREEEKRMARADVEAAEAQLREARAAAEQVRLRQHEVEAAQAQVAEAEAALQTAEAKVKLVEAGARPEDIEAARAQARQAMGALQEARAALKQIALRRRELTAAQAHTRQATARLQAAAADYKESLIVSPIDGVVARKLADVGELVTPMTPLFPGSELLKLVDTNRRWVVAEVDAEDLAKVFVGQNVTVTTEAHPYRAFKGRVREIGAMAEPKPGGRTRAKIVRVQIDLLDPAPELKPGLEVDVKAHATLDDNALLVPNDAIIINGGKSQVFVVVNDRVRLREVQLGKRNPTRTEIIKGLSEGDRVVVKGKEGLRDGMAVEVK